MSARYSQQTGDLMAALCKAQAEIVPPKKTDEAEVYSKRTGKSFKYSFATLAPVIAAIKDPAAKYGIAYTQPLLFDDRGVGCTTRLSVGDQWMEFDAQAPCDSDIQAMGSMVTYIRRYSLMAAFGIAPEDDDDGHAAMPALSAERPEQRPVNGKQKTEPVTTGVYDIKVGGKLRADALTDAFKLAWPKAVHLRAWVADHAIMGFASWPEVEQCDDGQRLDNLYLAIAAETKERAAKAASTKQFKDSIEHEKQLQTT